MKVLLSGGAGYIGSHVYVQLIQEGHDAFIIDNFSGSKEKVIKKLEVITREEVPYAKCDIRNIDELRSVMNIFSPDVIIHLAGYKAVRESIDKPIQYYDNNLNCTLSLLKLVDEFKIKKMVFSSSATVYGNISDMPIIEEWQTGACTNPYGWTKYMNEQIIRDFAYVHNDTKFVLLRYFNPVGAHESGEIGEDPIGIPNNIMPYLCKVALGKLRIFAIYGNDYPTKDGTCIRDYIHVMDLANGHVRACEANTFNETNTQVYNLGTGKGYSVLELLQAFMEANEITIPYEIAPRRAGDLPVCYANPEKARHELGWVAKRDLPDMCRDAWRWSVRNPEGFN